MNSTHFTAREVQTTETGTPPTRLIASIRNKIPAEKRTRPMTLRAAARLMGYGNSQDAAERLRAAVDAGAVAHEKLTRQQHIFSKDDFPKDVWSQLVPTGPKSP
jgi:hypothetical protein